MTLHDLITLMILPIGTSGYKEIQHIKYTTEYISKLQIHQQMIVTCFWLHKAKPNKGKGTKEIPHDRAHLQ